MENVGAEQEGEDGTDKKDLIVGDVVGGVAQFDED